MNQYKNINIKYYNSDYISDYIINQYIINTLLYFELYYKCSIIFYIINTLCKKKC